MKTRISEFQHAQLLEEGGNLQRAMQEVARLQASFMRSLGLVLNKKVEQPNYKIDQDAEGFYLEESAL